MFAYSDLATAPRDPAVQTRVSDRSKSATGASRVATLVHRIHREQRDFGSFLPVTPAEPCFPAAPVPSFHPPTAYTLACA